MATTSQAPVTKDFEVSASERLLVVRALETLRASVNRAAKAEHDDEIRRMREAESARIDTLILRFR